MFRDATCFEKDCTPSLNDVILTKASTFCIKLLNFPTGVSDCHNFFFTVINANVPKDEMSKFEYRSFRSLNYEEFVADMHGIDFSPGELDGGDVNSVYDQFESEISMVVNKQVPIN